LAGLFRGGVDADLIREQWDQLVRVAASLKNRVCPAHLIVQRLANSSPSDRLAKALTMLGRVVKTIYILKNLNEEVLRHRVQLQLNRGEHRHSLARWIFFADQGEFRTGGLPGDHEQGELLKFGTKRHLGLEHAPDCQNPRDSPTDEHRRCR
jgi:TnpA family transposase